MMSLLLSLLSLTSLSPLMSLHSLLCLVAVTRVSSLRAVVESADLHELDDEFAWSEFAAAAVRAAPRDAHLMVVTPTPAEGGPMPPSLIGAIEAAWAVPRDIVHLTCDAEAYEVTWGPERRLQQIGAMSYGKRIVLVLCPLEEVARMFKQVVEDNLEAVWMRWIVLTTNNDAAATLQPLLRTGAQVTVVERRRRGDKYNILGSEPHPDHTMRITHVGSWLPTTPSPELGVLMYPPPDLHYTNMKGRQLRIAVVNNWPFFGFIDHQNGTVTPTSGIDHSVVEAVAEALNFTYRVVPSIDGQYGGVQEDGTITGLTGMNARHEVDFTMDEFTINGGREDVLDFTRPYYTESTCLLNRIPKEISRPLAVFSPFTRTVWGALMFVTLAISMVVFSVQKLLELQARSCGIERRVPRCRAREVLFNMFRSVVIQGNYLDDSLGVLRLVLVTWYLFCMIIYALYAGTMTASLASPSMEKPINSLEELLAAAEAGRFQPAVLVGTTVATLFTSAEEGSLYHGINKATAYVNSVTKGIDMVLEGTGIYMQGETSLELQASRKGWHNFYIGRDRFYMQMYGAACPSGSPFRLQLNIMLARLDASGLIQYWKRQEVRRLKTVREVDPPTDRALTIIQMQGAFMLYGLGMTSAILALLYEGVTSKGRT